MKIGIINEETWIFFQDVYDHIKKFHQVEIFEPRKVKTPLFSDRINKSLYHYDLQSFLNKNDVIFFEWASELLAYASHLKKTSRVITRLHRYEMYQWADKINWEYVDKIIFVSEHLNKEFNDSFPGHREKTIVIPVGVCLEKFQPFPKVYRGDIGILCNLQPRKRIYDLLLTFSELLNISQRFHLHIAGGADPFHMDYYKALQYITNELDISDKVTFYGKVAEPQKWYRNIDIFVSNSYSEGLQVAPMEAMACGCYTLSHKWQGADELLPDDNLYDTSSDLIEHLLRYHQLPEDVKLIQREDMREIVKNKFNIEDVLDKIQDILELQL